MWGDYRTSPVEQRAEFRDDGYQTTITIPSAKKVIRGERLYYASTIAVILIIFIPGGTSFLIATFMDIRSEPFGFYFALGWSSLVLYSLWAYIRMAAWRQRGQETIIIDPQHLIIRYNGDPRSHKTVYELKRIQPVEIKIRPRAVENPKNYFECRRAFYVRYGGVWRYTTLRFRYGRRIVRFGREITRADAEMIRDAINKKLNAIA
jgi:hypothetical protein